MAAAWDDWCRNKPQFLAFLPLFCGHFAPAMTRMDVRPELGSTTEL